MQSRKGNYHNNQATVLTLERLITILLGIFWFIDGILQFQPEMFTKAFITNVITPNLQGQPLFILNIIQFGIHLFTINPFLANLGAAMIQVFIALALLLPLQKNYQRLALYISIAWSLVVWILGEGLGNMLTGMASFYTGAPGSVMLYLILAIFLLFPKRFPLTKLPQTAGILLLLGALLNLLPMFWTKDGIQQMIFQPSASDPITIISAPAKYIASLMSSSPVVSNAILVLLPGFFGVQLLLKPKRVIVWSIIISLALVWWLCQDLGGIQTFPQRTATDLNSAPLFALFLTPLLYTKNWNIAFPKLFDGGLVYGNTVIKIV